MTHTYQTFRARITTALTLCASGEIDRVRWTPHHPPNRWPLRVEGPDGQSAVALGLDRAVGLVLLFLTPPTDPVLIRGCGIRDRFAAVGVADVHVEPSARISLPFHEAEVAVRTLERIVALAQRSESTAPPLPAPRGIPDPNPGIEDQARRVVRGIRSSADRSPTYQILSAGGWVDFRQPPETWDYDPADDLVPALFQIPRFGGHLQRYPWSVGHHSLLVATILVDDREDTPTGDPDVALLWALGLVHDLHEGLVGDIPTPLKRALGPEFHQLDRGITQDVHRRLGLPVPVPTAPAARIHDADFQALTIEAHRFGNDALRAWASATLPAPDPVVGGHVDALLRRGPAAHRRRMLDEVRQIRERASR